MIFENAFILLTKKLKIWTQTMFYTDNEFDLYQTDKMNRIKFIPQNYWDSY